LSWKWLAVATEAVLKAGALQKARYGDETVRIEHKGEIDLVTEVDHACEEVILETLRSQFPEHDIVTEETDLARKGSRYVWYTDPLDGTTNFAHGYPFFCSSVALTVDGQVVAGAVYEPLRADLFTAERGAGAFLNGRRLKASSRAQLLQSLLVTGFPYDLRDDLAAKLLLFNRFMGEARAIRRDGAAALDLCYVAAGRVDGFWEERLQPWDMMAGILMVEEAGGLATRFDGAPLRLQADEIVAANPALHARMLEVLAGNGAADRAVPRSGR
jgi:myo-inositol-1(or 4)-monophosphatase